MDDIETKVLTELRDALPYMSKSAKEKLLVQIETVKDTVRVLNGTNRAEEPRADEEETEGKEV